MTEIITIDAAIDDAVQQLQPSDLAITQMREEAFEIQVQGPDDDAGIQRATEYWKRVKRVRTALEAKRKELKKDCNRYAQAIDGEARRLKSEIEPIEKHLESQANVARVEAARLEVEAKKEADRVLQERVQRLNGIGARIDLHLLKSMPKEDFERHFQTAKSESEERRRRQAEEDERRRVEAERLRVEREELEQQRRQVEEQQRVIREQAEAEERERAAAEEQARLEALQPELQQVELFVDRLRGVVAESAKRVWMPIVNRNLDEMRTQLQWLVRGEG